MIHDYYYNGGKPIPDLESMAEPAVREWQPSDTIVVFEGCRDLAETAEARSMDQEGRLSEDGMRRVVPRYVLLLDPEHMDDLLEALTAGAFTFDLTDIEVARSFPAKASHTRELAISFVYGFVEDEDEEDN